MVWRRESVRAEAASRGEGVLIEGPAPALGARTVIRERAALDARSGAIAIGSDGFVGPACRLRGPLRIGADALIAAGTRIEATPEAAIVIEDDVWIGLRARIEPGVRIGRGAIVGAGAWVQEDVPPGAIVLGRPARMRGTRGGGECAS